MSEINDINTDVLSEIFEAHEVSASSEQIEAIAKDFEEHLSMLREMEMTPFLSRGEVKCEKCERLKKELADLTREIGIYRNNVCIRRNTTQVWIEGETVRYMPE